MQQETVKPGKKVAPPAVLKEEPKALVQSGEFEAGGWESEKIDSKDIIIPKILLMHPTSDLVKQGKRNIGDIIKSNSEELIAARGQSVDVIVFDKWKTWRVMELKDKRYEWVREEPCTAENEEAPWDFEEAGKKFRRDKTMNFYCVLASEASNESVFPLKLSFTRTSYSAGLKIADAYSRALMDKQPPTRQSFKLTTELVNGEKETYFVFKVMAGEGTTPEQKAGALKWRQVVMNAKKTNTLKEHDIDEPTSVTTINQTDF